MLNDQNIVNDIYDMILLLETKEDVYNFLNDLCSPQEVSLLAERWRIYKILQEGGTYGEMYRQTGISAATMELVVRLLKDEPRCGYSDNSARFNVNEEPQVRMA